MLLFSTSATTGVADLSELDVLHEASILHNLKVRYGKNDVYTFVVNILCVLNPFKPLSCYSSDIVSKYHKAGEEVVTLSPHIFATAQLSYSNMSKSKEDQVIIITGESGAGAPTYLVQVPKEHNSNSSCIRVVEEGSSTLPTMCAKLRNT